MEKGNGMVAKCAVHTGDGTDTEYIGEGNGF